MRIRRQCSIGIALLVASIGCNGSMTVKVPTYPTMFAKHWVSVSDPESKGLLLEKDGHGRLAGIDGNGPKIGWQIIDNKLELVAYGEEGEHGPFQPSQVTIGQGTLKISPPFQGMETFRDLSSSAFSKTPVLFDVIYKDDHLSFIVLNNSKSPLVVTGHMGYLSATVGQGSSLRHLFDDGFNADVNLLNINDLTILQPGKSTAYNRAMPKELQSLVRPGSTVECSINPISLSQIESNSRVEATKLSRNFLQEQLRYKLVIPRS